ncbi:unnamed protein product, partial [Rotaria socialis]
QLDMKNDENEVTSHTLINEDNKEQKDAIKITNQEPTQVIIPVLVEKPLNRENDLDEILRRNENRCIRLTDSDDEDCENFQIKKTPVQNFNNNDKRKL